MPIKYLRDIELMHFPIRVDNRQSIKYIAALKAIGMVEAEVYPLLSLQTAFKPYEAAIVKGITPDGHAALARERGEIL